MSSPAGDSVLDQYHVGARILRRLSTRIAKWTNAYATGDYVGRNLWSRNDISYTPGIHFQDATRNELCIGEGGHIRYWDGRWDEIAEV